MGNPLLECDDIARAEIADVYFGRVDSVGFVAWPGRLIALVALYVGTHIHPDEFCYEGIVPIDTQPRRAL